MNFEQLAIVVMFFLCFFFFFQMGTKFFTDMFSQPLTFSANLVKISSKIASLGGQEPQPAGTTKWATTLRFGKILGTTSVVIRIQNPRNVVRCKTHRP